MSQSRYRSDAAAQPESDQGSTGTVRIGVVTPTLNAGAFLERTLRSIWRQRRDGLEVDHVIVDGGSKDDTAAIASRFPSRFLVAEDERGMYEAINLGLRLVRGDVVGYMNGDDEVAPGAFDAVVSAFASNPDAGWLCGRVEYIDGQGRVLGRMRPVSMSVRSFVGLGWSCIPQQTVWARRSFFDHVGPFDATYRAVGDYDWYVRAMQRSAPLILRDTLGRFRLHDAQISANVSRMQEESRELQRRYGFTGMGDLVAGKALSLRLNARNIPWLIAKKTGRISFG